MGAFNELDLFIRDHVDEKYAGNESIKQQLVTEIDKHIQSDMPFDSLSKDAQAIVLEWEGYRLELLAMTEFK